jgi:hypothetical protein
MQVKPEHLLQKLDLTTPLIGLYDAPAPSAFEPLVSPKQGGHMCTFAFYNAWLKGKTLHITKDNFGCGGAGHHLFHIETRSREDFIKFLGDDEGLKASYELMDRWLDYIIPYTPDHANILIGPLREDQDEYLKTVTFYVNPDQLGLLMLGAQYNNGPGDPVPVLAPFGSGCMQLVTLFEDLSVPQAVIGATDIAMRQFLPPDIVAFTVTLPLFQQFCELDEKSFLYKPFWKNLKKARRLSDF